MARPLRIVAAGLTYHVFARGARGIAIYTEDRDRRQFLALLTKALSRHHVICHAFCLMGTHYHLVITTTKPNLPQCVQQVNSEYAQWWNTSHSGKGHLFQARYGAQIVQDDCYLLTVARYVVRNPVRAGLVSSPEKWPWSSYRATAGLGEIPSFLHPDLVWRYMGSGDTASCVLRYRAFVAIGDPGQFPKDPVLGDEAFVRRFEALRAASGAEVPAAQRRTRPPLPRIFDGAITTHDRDARAAAARNAGYSLSEIAAFLHVHYSTVSKMARRAPGGSLVPELEEAANSRSDPALGP